MTPFSVVTWKWAPRKGYRSTFGPEAVNVLRRMVARHYPEPFRFLCVTDDAAGLDPEVEVVPDWKDFADLPAPTSPNNPSCYRRLRAFAPDIGDTFGPRFVSLDLDMVITGDLRPLWQRHEDFVVYGDTNPQTFYNGSMFLLTAGARSKVWTTFDPRRSPQQAKVAGHRGSDQGWISHCLGRGEAKWTKADGVYSFRNHLKGETPFPVQKLPPDAKVVVFHGLIDPWTSRAQRIPWVQEHYH